MSDAELVGAAQRGDVASLGLLLERYRAPLYGLALRLLGSGSEAQDAVQDTFLVALRKIDQVREPAAVGGWLHMILRNVCLMRMRAGQGEILYGEISLKGSHGAITSPRSRSRWTAWRCAGGCERRSGNFPKL